MLSAVIRCTRNGGTVPPLDLGKRFWPHPIPGKESVGLHWVYTPPSKLWSRYWRPQNCLPKCSWVNFQDLPGIQLLRLSCPTRVLTPEPQGYSLRRSCAQSLDIGLSLHVFLRSLTVRIWTGMEEKRDKPQAGSQRMESARSTFPCPSWNFEKLENATFENVLPSCYEGIPLKLKERNLLFVIIFTLIYNFLIDWFRNI